MRGETGDTADSSAIRTACARLVGHTLEVVERELIIQTLKCHRGNRTHAAQALGISVRALRNKIRGYRNGGEDVPEPSPVHALQIMCHRDSGAERVLIGAVKDRL